MWSEKLKTEFMIKVPKWKYASKILSVTGK